VAKTFDLSVVSADRTLVAEVSDMIIAPGKNGYFGVLAGHEPFLTSLKPGIVLFNDAAGHEQKVAISGGFLETDGSKVIVLADAAERVEEIDVERAMKALERAKARLAEKSQDVNLSRATASLERAANRLRATGR
jgi:F-type H+-transporting ATPase subunit epsilon